MSANAFAVRLHKLIGKGCKLVATSLSPPDVQDHVLTVHLTNLFEILAKSRKEMSVGRQRTPAQVADPWKGRRLCPSDVSEAGRHFAYVPGADMNLWDM